MPSGLARLGLDNPRGLVWWVIIAGTLVRLASSALYGFGYDEGYYLASARHPALSYFDHPPLSIWLISATHWLTGSDAALVLRLPFIAMFAVTTWLMYRLGARLFGEKAGAFAALLLSVSPVFTAMTGVWMRPDGPLMLFLVATMLAMARLALDPSGGRRLVQWIVVGGLLGLALLSKYHAALLPAGFVLFALTSRPHRRWFREPGPYLAVALALAIFSPALIWNAQNDWVSFSFHTSRAAAESGIHPEWLLRMLLGQIAFIGPWIWVPMLVVFWRALRGGPGDTARWMLACAGILPILLFTVAALWSPVGWLFHWQAPGYLMLFPLLGAAIAGWAERGRRWLNPWLAGSVAVTIILVLALSLQAATGWWRHILPEVWLESFDDPTLEGHDWTELRTYFDEAGLTDREDLFAVTTLWMAAGKVDGQIGGDIPVVCLCDDPQNIAFGWDQQSLAGRDAVIIVAFDDVADPVATYAPYFDSIETLEPVTILRGGMAEFDLTMLYGTNYNGGYPLPLPR